MNFSKETSEKILSNQIDADTLTKMYPNINVAVMKEFSKIINSNSVDGIFAFINIYKTKENFAIDKINKNRGNINILNTFLPDIIKSQIAINFMEQVNFAVPSGENLGKVKFNWWN